MYVWKFAFTQEILDVIQAQEAAGTFKTGWFGIWNTLKYSGEEPVEWTPNGTGRILFSQMNVFQQTKWQPISRANTLIGAPM